MFILIDYLLKNGMDFLVVVGIIGEFLIFFIEEKIVFFEYMVKEVNGWVLVIVGIGSNNMKDFIKLIKKVEEVGVDVVMFVMFYYNKFF